MIHARHLGLFTVQIDMPNSHAAASLPAALNGIIVIVLAVLVFLDANDGKNDDEPRSIVGIPFLFSLQHAEYYYFSFSKESSDMPLCNILGSKC